MIKKVFSIILGLVFPVLLTGFWVGIAQFDRQLWNITIPNFVGINLIIVVPLVISLLNFKKRRCFAVALIVSVVLIFAVQKYAEHELQKRVRSGDVYLPVQTGCFNRLTTGHCAEYDSSDCQLVPKEDGPHHSENNPNDFLYYEFNCKDGKYDGIMKRYHQGELERQAFYSKGHQLWAETYDPSGNIIRQEGSLEAYYTRYYDESDAGNKSSEMQSRIYQDSEGKDHVYLAQIPDLEGRDPAGIFIYMHGAAGKEEQGMDLELFKQTFKRLRKIMLIEDWIYVCPRDPELDGLLKDLKKRYPAKRIYLAGASAGGVYALKEAELNPSRYQGVILLCPALWDPSLKFDTSRLLPMPSYIVAGAKDRGNVEGARKLVNKLKELNRPYVYVEIPGGGHDAPLEQINWGEALSHLNYNQAGE